MQVEQLAEQVEQANMDEEVKVTHEALTEVMKGWKGEGKVGDNCPKLMMVTPCSVKDHHPVEGKGYFCCLVERVAQTRSEIIKGDPEAALSGPVICGYLGCKSSFFQAVQS